MSTSALYTTLDWMKYLAHPPPSSWVSRVAATFRWLAVLLIVPCVFLTLLDIASYLIVRTLGADTVHRLDPLTPPSDYPPADSELSPGPTSDQQSLRPPSIEVSSEPDVCTGELHPKTYFSTSSDGNFALAGEGIFSPPGSRPASPPVMRHPRQTSGNTTDGEDNIIIRKRR